MSIQGNCDPRATEQYNLALGRKRADATKNYLVGLGVDAELLETVSYGEDRPSCQENDESCWAQERRVDFKPMPRLLFDELKSMCEAQQPHKTLCPKENLKVGRENIESRMTQKDKKLPFYG